MRPSRTIEILKKLKAKHKNNPDLYLPDEPNENIIMALEVGIHAVETLLAMASLFVEEDEDDLK